MTVQQRLGGLGKVNTGQIILIAISIIGAAAFAIMMLNIYGGGGGETKVIERVVTTAAQNATVIRG